MRFELVREKLGALPRELPAAPAILTPIRLDSPEPLFPPEGRGSARGARGRPAAVLVLLFPDAEGQARVLLTARATHMGSHAGEVSFPGGSAEEGDEDPIATAVREAVEEVGLQPAACGLRVTGILEVFALTVSGFRIVPVVALAERRPECSPAPAEVARVLEAPVEVFLPDAPVELEERTIRRRLIRYGVYPVEGERVWGATARMLGQLGALLAVEPGPAEAGAAESAPEPRPRTAIEPAPGAESAAEPVPRTSLEPAPAAERAAEPAPAAGDHLVRAATPDDGPAIRDFLETLAPELARHLPPAAEQFLAEVSGRVAGVAGWAPWGRDRSADDPRGFDGLTLPDGDCAAEMTLLAVAPHLRGRGIGRGLTSAVAGAAGAAGNTRLLAWTLADSDAHPSSVAARAFFRSNGFADLAVDRRIQALGEDRLLLSRPLG